MTNLVKRYGLIGPGLVVLAAAIIGRNQLRDPHAKLGHIQVFGNVDVRPVKPSFKVPGRLSEMMADEGAQAAAGARPEPKRVKLEDQSNVFVSRSKFHSRSRAHSRRCA